MGYCCFASGCNLLAACCTKVSARQPSSGCLLLIWAISSSSFTPCSLQQLPNTMKHEFRCFTSFSVAAAGLLCVLQPCGSSNHLFTRKQQQQRRLRFCNIPPAALLHSKRSQRTCYAFLLSPILAGLACGMRLVLLLVLAGRSRCHLHTGGCCCVGSLALHVQRSVHACVAAAGLACQRPPCAQHSAGG